MLLPKHWQCQKPEVLLLRRLNRIGTIIDPDANVPCQIQQIAEIILDTDS